MTNLMALAAAAFEEVEAGSGGVRWWDDGDDDGEFDGDDDGEFDDAGGGDHWRNRRRWWDELIIDVKLSSDRLGRQTQ